MADFTYGGPSSKAPAGRRVANMANWAGAAVSLALVAGVGVWGYKLLVRDVTGVPVVRAMEGPMRMAPEDPGGTLADHQGLAVNAVAGTGVAEPVPDKLLLAPEALGLTDEDLPRDELPVLAAPEPEKAPSATARAGDNAGDDIGRLSSSGTDATSEMSLSDETDPDIDPIQALANKIAANAAPLSDLEPGEDIPVSTELSDAERAEAARLFAGEEAGETQASGPVPPGALTRSLRPKTRPEELSVTAAVAALSPEPVEAEGPVEISPDSLPAGTRLAQLGAYDSPATARTEWARFGTRFGDYMEGKQMVIERATSGGRVFYRLRAHGFEDLSDARRFCAAFVAENADCIPVTTR